MFRNQTSRTSGTSLASAMVIAAGLLAGVARAQPDGAGNDYCVTHTFRLRTGGTALPAVFLKHKEKTYARTNCCIDEDKGEGTLPIGLGITTVTVTSLAPDSNADATAEANITMLVPGEVRGTVEARGNANALLTGCPPPNPPRGFGRATAYSAAQVTARGRNQDADGTFHWAGGWRNSLPVAGSKARRVVKDPIKGRLIDNTTGITTELVMLSLHSTVSGGETKWESGTLSNTATDMSLNLTVGGAFAVQSGVLIVAASGGVVTESVATGIFAGLLIPAVGAPSAFSVPLAEIVVDYNMGADPSHDVDVEIDFDGAGHAEDDAAGIGDDGGSSLVTDIGTGYDGANVSSPLGMDTIYGFNTNVTSYRVADDFEIPVGPPALLDALSVPIYETGAPEVYPIMAAYVRLWYGEPGMGGFPIAGDMTTNRLMDYRYDALNRVVRSAPLNSQRMVKEAFIDMSWAPALSPGRYWVEVATQGQNFYPGPWTPPSTYATERDNAKIFTVATGTWAPLRDTGSGRFVDTAFKLYGPAGQHQEPCYANCDGSLLQPLITANDFQCFINRYASGDAYANCDGSTGTPMLTANDFQCFLNSAANGCS